MAQELGRVFYTIVRSITALKEILEADPFEAFHLPASAKRVVTFLREPHKAKLSLPIEDDGAQILRSRAAKSSPPMSLVRAAPFS